MAIIEHMFEPISAAITVTNPVPDTLAACDKRLRTIAQLRSWLSLCHSQVVHQVTKLEAARNPRGPHKRTSDRVKENTGCSSGQARRDTANANQLSDMDATRDAMNQGAIPTANADQLTRLRASLDPTRRAAFDADEPTLVEAAKTQTPEQFRRTLTDWAHLHSGDDGTADAQRRRDKRRLSLTTGDDTMGILRGELDPENYETVRRAITDIANELFHAGKQPGDSYINAAGANTPNNRLLADALVELARRGASVDAHGAHRARPTVIVTINHTDLIGTLEANGVTARLADGTPIPAETARRLACDANLIPTVLGGHSEPLDVGRSRRLATPAQRTALRTLYPTCAATGCDRPYDWCHIHHHTPWQAGGPTNLDNLVPLCAHHHTLIHEGRWATTRNQDGTLTYTNPPDPPDRRSRPDTTRQHNPPPRNTAPQPHDRVPRQPPDEHPDQRHHQPPGGRPTNRTNQPPDKHPTNRTNQPPDKHPTNRTNQPPDKHPTNQPPGDVADDDQLTLV